jgi:hypothetical protein
MRLAPELGTEPHGIARDAAVLKPDAAGKENQRSINVFAAHLPREL